MRYHNVHIIYFSPTHTSAKIVHEVVEGIGAKEFIESDITCEMLPDEELLEDELVLVAVPVYGGRVPDVAAERLAKFHGNQTPVVPIVVYGNRDYDDALLELTDLLRTQGFRPFAAAAFIGEHSFSRPATPIAEGRPDEDDHRKAVEFGRQIRDKFNLAADSRQLSEPKVKGHFPYKEKMPSQPMAPTTNVELCTMCGHCLAICPVEAISVVDGEMYSDPQRCIKCSACVKECPEGARTLDSPFAAILHKNFSARKEPEIFL